MLDAQNDSSRSITDQRPVPVNSFNMAGWWGLMVRSMDQSRHEHESSPEAPCGKPMSFPVVRSINGQLQLL